MRTSGTMEYITPLQIATESSTVPKSVMKTMVGIGLADAPAALIAQRISNSRVMRLSDRTFLRMFFLAMVRSR
jgi:hypothetical protein